jgi:hypothetical protein
MEATARTAEREDWKELQAQEGPAPNEPEAPTAPPGEEKPNPGEPDFGGDEDDEPNPGEPDFDDDEDGA